MIQITITSIEIFVAAISILISIVIIKRRSRIFNYEKRIEYRITGYDETTKRNKYKKTETKTLHLMFIRWFYIETEQDL
jgi:hypothetical protein